MDCFNPNPYFKYLLWWIAERQRVFWQRRQGTHPPYTQDIILQRYKFTNVYRVLDAASQAFIHDIASTADQYSPSDNLYRTLLWRHFNKAATWRVLTNHFGADIRWNSPTPRQLIEFLGAVKPDLYNKAYMLNNAFTVGRHYSQWRGGPKYAAYLAVWGRELFDHGRADDIMGQQDMEAVYVDLTGVSGMGRFMSYQTCIDLGYTGVIPFDENSFVIPGGGALRGIARVTDHCEDPVGLIRYTQHHLPDLMQEYNEAFTPLPGRVPTLVDIQNCYCEIGKYLKALHPRNEPGERRPARKYYPQGGFFFTNAQQEIVFPKHWKIKPLCTPSTI